MSRSSRRRKRRRRDRKRALRAIARQISALVLAALEPHVGQTPAEWAVEDSLRAQGYRIVEGSLWFTGPCTFSCRYAGEIHKVEVSGVVSA